MKKKGIFILSLFSVILFSSCVNEEGVGGTSAVEGFVIQVHHPDGEYNFSTDTFPAAETRVYIQYGGEEPYSDDMRTGADGYFKFKYLNKGTYTVFAYNEYPNGRKEAVKETITVRKGETQATNHLYIHSGKMFGKHQVKGLLKAKFVYSNNSGVETLRKDTVPVAGERVYIRKKSSEGTTDFPHFDDVRTNPDGTFIFEKLAAGEYEIYALSEDPYSRESFILDEGIMQGLIEVNLSEDDETVEVGTIYAKLRS